jgi:hypothetical protein
MEINKQGIRIEADLVEVLSSAAGRTEPPDNDLKDRLMNAWRAALYNRTSQPDLDHIDEVKRREYRAQAEELIADTGIAIEDETRDNIIPWSMAPQLGKACLHILANPQKYRPYMDPACGGYTVPWAVKELYENVGRLSAAIAVQENFTTYQYPNPYES